MSRFTFERCATGAPRVWFECEGFVPELVRPLAAHRRKWGDTFDWGKGEDGCHLLAATLLNRVGLPCAIATWFAPHLVWLLLADQVHGVWRMEMSDLRTLTLHLIHEHVQAFARSLAERSVRHVVKS